MNKILKITSYIVLITFLFAQIGFADTIYFYHTDPAGTPIAMTDASGSVVWKADYKPFGEEWSITSNIENNKRFVGKEKDTETGLNYFGARYMSSNIGRFISTDAVGPVNPAGKINQIILSNPQRLNLYSYGLNNPYKYVDTDGFFSVRATPNGFDISFREYPSGIFGKGINSITNFLLGFGTGAKLVRSSVKYGFNKGLSAVAGSPVSYDKKGLFGIGQWWNEPATDQKFWDSLSDDDKKMLTEQPLNKQKMLSILEKFKELDEYEEMDYPSPENMVEKAQKNFDSTYLGGVNKNIKGVIKRNTEIGDQ